MDSYKWETFITKLKNKKNIPIWRKKGKYPLIFVPERVNITENQIYVLNGQL